MIKTYKYIRESSEKELQDFKEMLKKNLYNKYYSHYFALDYFPDFSVSKNNGFGTKWLSIINDKKENIGFIQVVRNDVKEVSDISILIFEGHNKKGYGKKSFKEALNFFKKIGIKRVIARTTNKKLINFYLSFGFRKVGFFTKKIRLVDSKLYDEIMFEKVL